MSLPDNPKKIMGDKKPPLHLLPAGAMAHWAMAHLDGNLKYGFENWNETPVTKLTYIGGMLRHIELYKYGENNARDTTVHNLGAVMACCAILIDAELNGNLIDDTRHSKATCDLLHDLEHQVEHLKQLQKQRDQDKISASWADAANADRKFEVKVWCPDTEHRMKAVQPKCSGRYSCPVPSRCMDAGVCVATPDTELS